MISSKKWEVGKVYYEVYKNWLETSYITKVIKNDGGNGKEVFLQFEDDNNTVECRIRACTFSEYVGNFKVRRLATPEERQLLEVWLREYEYDRQNEKDR